MCILLADSMATDHEWIANATGNLTEVDLDCPQFSEQSERIVSEFSFWVEGVTQVTTKPLHKAISKLHSIQ